MCTTRGDAIHVQAYWIPRGVQEFEAPRYQVSLTHQPPLPLSKYIPGTHFC